MKDAFELISEMEVIPRIKCRQCHTYMPKETISFFCMKCMCKCNDLQIVREIVLRCTNCHCAVKVEELKVLAQDEDLLFSVLKNAK